MREVLAAFLLLALSPLASTQRTLRVPAHYSTISAAVAAAGPGDTVLVAPGVYRELVDFAGKDIRLISEAGPAHTVIDREGQGPCVFLAKGEPSTALIEGFTLQNGNHGPGGGILCSSRASPTIRGNVFRRNRANLGGGIACLQEASPRIIGNRFIENVGFQGGGGVYIGGGGTVILDGNEFLGGFAYYGGGVYCDQSGVLLVNNVFRGNRAGDGGAICMHRNIAVVTNNTIVRNLAHGLGGGIRVYWATEVRLANTILWDNRARLGAELDVNQSTVVVTHCLVRDGWPGTNVLDADPRLADADVGDVHLLADSPCIGAGTTGAIGLPPLDIEGDPRLGDSKIDIGADEHHLHLYLHGDPQPGETVSIGIVGPPGGEVYLAAASRLRSPPLAIPGLGELHLALPVTPVRLGTLSTTGLLAFPVTLPAATPPGLDVALQAAVVDSSRGWLTNPVLATTRPVPVRLLVPEQHRTIQEAIDAAPLDARILVGPGVYQENLETRGKGLVLVARDGPATTTLDGGLRGCVVRCSPREGSWARLEGFTITRGSEGGVRVEEYSAAEIVGNVIVANQGSGIVGSVWSAAVIRDNEIRGNVAESGGGIAFTHERAVVLVEGNWIHHNGANTGGGIRSGKMGVLVANRIHSNAAAHGAGIYGSGWIANNVVFRNGGTLGGGAYVEVYSWSNDRFTVVVHNTFCENTATTAGSGLYLCDYAQVVNNIIWRDWIYVDPGSPTPVVAYNNAYQGYPGVGNISMDPKFVAPSSFDFRLAAGSPCVDAGTRSLPGLTFGLPRCDFEGDPRIIGKAPDMGADERR